MIAEFANNKEGILDPFYRGQEILPVAETFKVSELQTILGQNDCESLRVYLAMDRDLKVRLVLVGVDSAGDDILPNDCELIMERGDRCPPGCSASPLLP